MQIFDWLESTALAHWVGESLWITASFSATHLIGFTLVMSAGVSWNLRASGVLLARSPLPAIARPARRFLLTGLGISLVTGFALFAPRASYTAPSGVFQLKLTLILLAASLQLALNTAVLRSRPIPAPWLRASGVLGLALWLSLAGTACYFILFE